MVLVWKSLIFSDINGLVPAGTGNASGNDRLNPVQQAALIRTLGQAFPMNALFARAFD
jgi:hypothetical protein